jgi:acyl carrier protein
MNREEIFNKMVDFIVANNKEIKKEQIMMDSTFEDLNLDSLDLISTITDLEKQYNIILSNEEVANIKNVSQAIDVIEKHIAQN